MHMEPATSLIAKFGGVEAVAAITASHVSRVYRWTYSRAKGGTDGVIPMKHVPKLLDHARENGIDISPEEFVPGAHQQRPVTAAATDAPTVATEAGGAGV